MTFIHRLNEIRGAHEKGNDDQARAATRYSTEITKMMFDVLRDIMIDHPDLDEFYWAQEYNVERGFHLITYHLSVSRPCPLSNALNDIGELFSMFTPNEFRMVFGDHKMIRVSKKGVKIDFYEPSDLL